METMNMNRAVVRGCVEISNRCAKAFKQYLRLSRSGAPPVLIPCFVQASARKRANRTRYTPHLLACAATVLGTLASSATPPPAGVAPVTYPAGGFAIDGDLVANSPSTGTGDWLAFLTPGAGTGGSVFDQAGAPLVSFSTFHFFDAFSSTPDTTFSGGLKWTDNPRSWAWTTRKPS